MDQDQLEGHLRPERTAGGAASRQGTPLNSSSACSIEPNRRTPRRQSMAHGKAYWTTRTKRKLTESDSMRTEYKIASTSFGFTLMSTVTQTTG